jgi:hypothetical protein
MRKAQFERLCRDLDESVDVKSVIDKYKNKTGWEGARTLGRYAQVRSSFLLGKTLGQSIEESDWGERTVSAVWNWLSKMYPSTEEEVPERVSEASGSGDDRRSVSTPERDHPTGDLEIHVGSWTQHARLPGIVRHFSTAWTLDIIMTNLSRKLPVGIKSFELEASRKDGPELYEVHALTHIGKDVEGSHHNVPISDSDLNESVRIVPATTIRGKLRFIDHVPFDPQRSVALTLIVEESDGHRHTLELGNMMT